MKSATATVTFALPDALGNLTKTYENVTRLYFTEGYFGPTISLDTKDTRGNKTLHELEAEVTKIELVLELE